ncbi:MAG: flagellar biosynthesis protein, FliO [Proteobacteria bacterium]|nr:flagellar biosynthesis protein, FliO [Pseudomonadota bacterium]
MQDLLVTWFGDTGATVVRYAVALAVVIGLLLLLRWVLRNYAVGGQLSIGRSRQSRLTVVEQVAVDQRRRLLLVRRDNVEHLILIGGGNDLVVEPTIIRGVPVGSLGRVTRPASSSPTAAEDVETPAAATPAVATVAPAAEAPAFTRPAPVPRPAPTVEPTRPAFPSHVAGEHPKATSIQARLNRAPPRPTDAGRAAPASPYIPPEAHRVEPTIAPISPIVSDKSAEDRPISEAPRAERRVAEPPRAMPADEPAPQDDGSGFDDLARQLDEALKSEIEDMKIEAATPTIEPPAIAEPAPKVEPPKPAPSAASAWLRPRPAQAPRPFVPREPAPPREAAPVAQQRLRPPVVEPRTVEPPAEPVVAPEPVVTPRATDTPTDAPEDDGRGGADFSSLENEMARLLDELAGDSKGKR